MSMTLLSTHDATSSFALFDLFFFFSSCTLVGRSSRWTTASLFSQPQLARRPKVPAEHVWSSVVVPLPWLRQQPGTHCPMNGSPQCHLLSQLEDVSISTIPGALSALQALCDYALYKSTFTLHYVTQWWLLIHLWRRIWRFRNMIVTMIIIITVSLWSM